MAIKKEEQFTSPSGVPYDYSPTSSALTPNANLLTPDTTKITADTLKPAEAMNFQTPEQTPITDVSKLAVPEIPELTATEQEQKQSTLSDTIQGLRTSLLGESATRASAEQAQGIPDLIKTQSDLSSQLKAIQNEAQAIPLQLQEQAKGRGITVGGLRPLETARLRTNAIQALGVSSLLEASRGNLATAQTLADRAVAQKYDPIKAELAASIANLETIKNDPRTSLQDKNRAIQMQAIQDAKMAEQARREQEEKEKRDFAISAAKYGADANTLKLIQDASSSSEALNIAGSYLGQEFKNKLEQDRFDRNMKTLEFKLSQEKFEQDKRQFNMQYALEQQKIALSALKDGAKQAKTTEEENKVKENTVSMLDGKISLLDKILADPGLDSAVGPNAFARGAFAAKDVFGAKQEFIGDVSSLVATDVVSTLLNIKAQGGTFGALSEKELDILKGSANKLSTWEKRYKNGNLTGYDVSEKVFKEEVNRLKSSANKLRNQLMGETGVGGDYSTEDLLNKPLPTAVGSTSAYLPEVWSKAK